MKIFLIIIFSLLILFGIILYFIPAPKQDFFKLYPHDDNASKSLKKLKSEITKKIDIEGVKWTYYIGGNGAQTILFIHGMGGAYEIWWQQISAFEKNYKIVTFTLPEEINTLKKTSDGILKILATEHIDKFIVVGTSMGGYIAQYLVNTIPGRIEKAVFSNTFPPNDLLIEQNKTKSKIVPLLPEILIVNLGNKQLKNQILPAANNSELLAAVLRSLPFSKKQFINRYYVVIDKFTAHPDKPEIHKIPKLIIESDNDPLVETKLRKQLKELYPEAEVYTFHSAGHFPYLNAADEYNKVLKTFLESVQ